MAGTLSKKPIPKVVVWYRSVSELEVMQKRARAMWAAAILAKQAADLEELRRLLNELAEAARARRTAETFALIHRIVPAYAPLGETARIGAAQ